MNPGLWVSHQDRRSQWETCAWEVLPADATEARADPLTERGSGGVGSEPGGRTRRRPQLASLLDELDEALASGVEILGQTIENIGELVEGVRLLGDTGSLDLEHANNCLLGHGGRLVGEIDDLTEVSLLLTVAEDDGLQLRLGVGQLGLRLVEVQPAVVACGELDGVLGVGDRLLGGLDGGGSTGVVLVRRLEDELEIHSAEDDLTHVLLHLDAVGGDGQRPGLEHVGGCRHDRGERDDVRLALVVEHHLRSLIQLHEHLAVDNNVDGGCDGLGLLAHIHLLSRKIVSYDPRDQLVRNHFLTCASW